MEGRAEVPVEALAARSAPRASRGVGIVGKRKLKSCRTRSPRKHFVARDTDPESGLAPRPVVQGKHHSSKPSLRASTRTGRGCCGG